MSSVAALLYVIESWCSVRFEAEPIDALPEPEPVVVKYAYAPPPIAATSAAVAAPATIFFLKLKRFIAVDLLGSSDLASKGSGSPLAPRKPRRPCMVCESTRPHCFLAVLGNALAGEGSPLCRFRRGGKRPACR